MKKNSFQKNASVGFNWCFDLILVIFLEMKFFSVFNQVHFKKVYNDWISQHFLKKITTPGSSHFSKSKWTGLVHCCHLTLDFSEIFLQIQSLVFWHFSSNFQVKQSFLGMFKSQIMILILQNLAFLWKYQTSWTHTPITYDSWGH